MIQGHKEKMKVMSNVSLNYARARPGINTQLQRVFEGNLHVTSITQDYAAVIKLANMRFHAN